MIPHSEETEVQSRPEIDGPSAAATDAAMRALLLIYKRRAIRILALCQEIMPIIPALLLLSGREKRGVSPSLLLLDSLCGSREEKRREEGRGKGALPPPPFSLSLLSFQPPPSPVSS